MPWILVSGFGPFENVADNPSAHLARALADEPPAGHRVHATVLPVSFERAPRAVDELLERRASEAGAPALLLGLGVHRKGDGYRLEVGARGWLERTDRQDVDGRAPAAVTPSSHPAACLRTSLAERLPALVAGRDGWRLSEDAGGYVCEWTYRHLLERGEALGVPALFVHVPRAEVRALERQAQELRALLEALLHR